MKVSRALFASTLLVPATATASPNDQIKLALDDADVLAPAKHLIELAPGQTEWMTEEETLELIRAGRGFFDITENPEFGSGGRAQRTFLFPAKPTHQEAVQSLLKDLSKKNMKDHLDVFTSFYTRYFRSDTGRRSSEWLLKQVNDTIAEAGAHEHGVHVQHFQHSWGQHSIIATIPGRSDKRVVIGAHQDSLNMWLPILRAPGADDDGSGTVTILEAFRTLLGSADLVAGKADNTLEFHWYSAEEGGLLGSQAIFSAYEKAGADVRAMLQQDMTGYVQGMLDAGQPESMGVITDFVHPGLTAFIKDVITEYCDIPYVETKCGYACSDHASASKAGYPSAFVIESAFEHSNQKIHIPEDTVEHLSFDHMLQHAKLTVAFAYELAYSPFDGLEAAPLV